MGHLGQVAEIEASLPNGIWVTGSSYRGIGIHDCIRQGRETAIRTLDYLNSLLD